MATTKKRINISVTKEVSDLLTQIAKRDQEPVATKAGALLEFALDIEEDRMLSAIADERMKGKVKWVPDSDAIWK